MKGAPTLKPELLEAVKQALKAGQVKGNVTSVQRRFRVSYGVAALALQTLKDRGVIG